MRRTSFALGCLLLAITFGALGCWQIERRAWKLDLIERVNARIAAAPVPPPPPADWDRLNARDDAYRRVQVSGVFLNDRETLVQAVTELGAGWWVITPLQTAQGPILVNRGFVPTDRRAAAGRAHGSPTGPATVVGLIRMSEPHGGFLRANNPAADRWYSRDVAAIAQARGLSHAAPYFIDADASANPGGYPVGGLTVVAFRNAHLAYALTWFGLAALSLAGLVVVLRAPAPRPPTGPTRA